MPIKKKQKNKKNSTITVFTFNMIVILLLLSLFILNILPSFNSIEEKKNELYDVITEKNKLLKEWINFADFKKFSTWNDVDRTLLWKIDNSFYTKNFINRKFPSYKEFLSNKQEKIHEEINSDKFKEKQEKIKKILPTYSEFSVLESDLNNPRFISYIEALFETFNLESNIKEIWISEVLPIEDKSWISWQKNNDLTDKEIFYTPLNVSILWQKKDILEFLHYAKNVWDLSLNEDDISIYSDNEIKKPIEWEENTEDYNIYENQIMEILRVETLDYLDSSTEYNSNYKDLSLYELVKKTQAKEGFKMDLSINFYMRGIPSYKIKELIDSMEQDVIDIGIDTSELRKEIKNAEVESWNIVLAIKKIDTVDGVMKIIEKDIKKLETNLIKKDINKEKLYKEILDYHNKIDNIKSILKEISRSLATE